MTTDVNFVIWRQLHGGVHVPETRGIGILGVARCANEFEGREERVSHSPTYGNVRQSPKTGVGLVGCQSGFLVEHERMTSSRLLEPVGFYSYYLTI